MRSIEGSFRPISGLAAIVTCAALAGAGCEPRKAAAPPHVHAVSQPPAPTGAAGDRVSAGMQANPLESTNILRSFSARGIVRSLQTDGRSIVIKHEEIPGFMPKMTMEFQVRNTNELKGLAAGDAVVFELKADKEESWIEGIRRASTNDLSLAAPADPSSAAILRANQLQPGELLPDGELNTEGGDTVRFSAFRGKALAFSFVFTRCPLPDYCPRMSRNFSRAREILLTRPDGPSNWQLLSISFDPAFDKPGVLSRYAYSYRGAITNQWLFASAPTNVLKILSSQLDFRFANEEGSFQHNLRTVVLDTQGRVYRNFEGNRWTPEELADAIVQASRR